tara:strand:- start:74 stop:244 length:171 start_codon:yes stop_codon:yes gene_type:complete
MKKYTFEMYIDVTEQTTVEANSLESAEKMVWSGNCDWEETKSEGGEIVMIGEEEVS